MRTRICLYYLTCKHFTSGICLEYIVCTLIMVLVVRDMCRWLALLIRSNRLLAVSYSLWRSHVHTSMRTPHTH